MVDAGPGHLGARLQQLRKDRRLTLDDLARMSGVSRSMLSQIERSQANPTVATVWALAEALHIEVGELLGVTAPSHVARIDVASPSFTPEMRSDDGLCVLKILSPADKVGKVEWYEMRIGAGGVLRSAAHAKGSGEHVTVLRGALVIEVGGERVELGAGATARYPADVPHCISNLGKSEAQALLVNLF